MPTVIITESQLELIKKNGTNKELLGEAQWYNTALDILGIFDPTPTVDFINAASYFYQGDNLFGFLSLISALPIVGDAVGKTAMGAMKAGGKSAQIMSKVSKAMDAGDVVKAQSLLKQMAKNDDGLGMLAKTSRSWAPKVDGFIDKIPMPKGFKSTVRDWLKLFRSAETEAASLASRLGSKSPKQQKELLQGLEAMIKREKFLDPDILTKPNFLQRIMYGGGVGIGRVTDLFGKSSMKTRVLIGKTKFWLGFLDFLGIGNFVGPEELTKEMGEDELLTEMKKYEKTPQAQKYLKQDIPPVDDKTDTEKDMSFGNANKDVISGLFNTLISGPQMG